MTWLALTIRAPERKLVCNHACAPAPFLAVPLFAQTPCADMARLRDVTAATQTANHCRGSITLRPSAILKSSPKSLRPNGIYRGGE